MNVELLVKIENFIRTVEKSKKESLSLFSKRDLKELKNFCSEAKHYFDPKEYEIFKLDEEVA